MRVDFFFAYGSTYTYLSVTRGEKLAAASGVTLRWRPFLLRKITHEQNNRPFIGKPVKLKYMWRDLERRALQHGIPFNGIPPYPIDAEAIAHRVGFLAATEGWCPQYSRAIYSKWFLEHKDPGDRSNLRSVLVSLGKNAESVISRADSEEIRNGLDSETDVARGMGIFGSPTFAVGEEIFWGDDRFEVALDWRRAAHR